MLRLPYAARAIHNRSGAVAAEFALVFPFLAMMLFGTIEFGSMFYSYSTMQTAARDVTRQMAVNTISTANATTELKKRVPNWMKNDMTVSVAQSAAGNASANVFTVKLEVPMKKAAALGFFSKVGNSKLKTEVQMKQELPYLETK